MNSAIYFSSSFNPFEIRDVRDICDNLKLTLLIENDFTNLIQKVLKTNPKFLFLNGNGPETIYLSKLLTSEIYSKVKIIVLSENFQCDNNYISVVSFKNLENYILSLKEYYFKETKFFDDSACKSKIKHFLLNLGINASSKGFDYIFECIHLLIGDNQYKCLKECYQIIKCNYDINNENNIDRNMRSAIQNAYESHRESWNDSFCGIFDKKPTCKNFICLSANKLKEELI